MKRETHKRLSLSLSRFGRGGFTLVEMMIAVAIIAILAAFLAPSVSTYVRRAKGQAAANELANVIRAARNQAMSRGEVIIATITTADGVTDGGGTIVLERVDAVGNPDCDAVTDSAVDFDTTTDPDCFTRSCAEAQSMTPATPALFTFDLGPGYPDMVIQGTDPAPQDNELKLCFAPSGRVLGTDGLPLESDSPACDAVNARFFVRLAEQGTSLSDLDNNPLSPSDSLSECITVNDVASEQKRQLQKNGRDVTNYYSITVPFNGAITVKQ